MKFFISLLLSLFILTNLSSQNPSQNNNHRKLHKALIDFQKHPEFKTASIAFIAVDINSGEIIAELNPNTSLKPASTLKLFTTATALEVLSPKYRFKTLLAYTGTIDSLNKTLNGNLFIIGSGDPTLGSEHFEETKSLKFLNQWVKSIKEAGINKINGHIIADATILEQDNIPSTWSWINIGNYFGAAPNGLTIFDNLYRIYFNTGSTIGGNTSISKMTPMIPGLTFDNKSQAAHIWYDKSNIFGAPYTYHRLIKGQLPVNKKNFPVKGAIPDPAYLAAYTLDSLLTKAGVIISNEPTTVRLMNKQSTKDTERTILYSSSSPTIDQIIYQTNQKSINLFAEHLLLETARDMGATTKTETAIDSLKSFWYSKGMDLQGCILYDGSGLSQYNAITATQMVFLLSYMKTKSAYFSSFKKSLAIAGETGTLEFMFKNTPSQGELIAKSGTIDNVKAYAGFTKTTSGRDIAFYIIVNNYTGKTSLTTKRIENLLNKLTTFDDKF